MRNRFLFRLTLATLIFTVAVLSVHAHDYVPGKRQETPILLRGGDLYTVSGGVLEGTDLLFENGRIAQIGKNISPPAGTETIDVSGKHVYPGLIAPNTTIGLTEIGAVDATKDISERGRNNANVQSHIAYNPDSEIIPVTRSNGITTALIVPGGSLIRGRSSLINLDGWTKEDAMEKMNLALHISWPRMSVSNAWWMEKSAEDQKKDNAENLEAVYKLFDQAKAYYTAKKADPTMDIDAKWEAMLPIFDKELPVFVGASDVRQIEMSIAFAKKQGIRIVIVGGREAWKVSDLLIENDIPVILSRTQASPMRRHYAYDFAYTLPKRLTDAGIKFCLSYGSASNVRNLPFQAGQAVAYGLSKEDALRSITLSTAEILGVDKEIGSLEVGKKATLIVSDGDIMDFLTNNVILEFIEGRKVDLDDKHKELYRKYREKNL